MWSGGRGFIHPTSVSLLHVLYHNNVINSTSLLFVFNLGFGSHKHTLLPTSPCSNGILVCAGANSVPECQEKCMGFTAHQQLFALCFLELEDFLLLSICRQINGNIIDFPWKKPDLSQCGKHRQTTLWTWAKPGKKCWRLQERLPREQYRCFKAATERPSTQPGGTGHSCSEETRPGATRAQNQLNWQQMREDPSTSHLHPHIHRAIPAHSSTAHTTCPREYPPLNKRRENRKKNSWKCSYSTGWN